MISLHQEGSAAIFSGKYWHQTREINARVRELMTAYAEKNGLPDPVAELKEHDPQMYEIMKGGIFSFFDFPDDFVPDRDFTMMYSNIGGFVEINGKRVNLWDRDYGRKGGDFVDGMTTEDLKELLASRGIDFALFAAVRFMSGHDVWNLLTRGHFLYSSWALPVHVRHEVVK